MTTEEFEYFESRFGSIDRQFAYFEEKFDAIDRRFDQIDIRFEEMDKKFEKKFDKVYNILDSQSKQLDDIQLEMAARSAILDRHEGWHHQTAKKLGLKLKY